MHLKLVGPILEIFQNKDHSNAPTGNKIKYFKYLLNTYFEYDDKDNKRD